MNMKYQFGAKLIANLISNVLFKSINNGWVYGYLCDENHIKPAYDTSYLIDPKTICRCTGLKDKNLSYIYEKNIVELIIFDCWGGEAHINCIVHFDELGVWFEEIGSWERYYYCSMDIDSESDIKIVGNVFDNPELLGVENG